jgi:hypothetical protein
MSAMAILKVLDLTLMVMERQQQVMASYKQVRDQVATMVAEGRDPTDAEWQELENRLAAANKTLDDRADEARALMDQDPLGR